MGTKSSVSSYRVQKPGALDVRVVVDGLDEARSLLVGRLRDGAHDRLVPGLGLDCEDLSRLDVGAEPDGERGETVESLLVHGWGIRMGGRPAGR